MSSTKRWGRRMSAAIALSVFLSVLGTASASACSGGIAFDWAVAHQHGGIARAVVESRVVLPDFSEELVLSDPQPVRGDPPLRPDVIATAGAPCDQSADVGETILLIYDVHGLLTRLPLYYVVRGPDALSSSELQAGLALAPATDTRSERADTPPRAFNRPGLIVSAIALMSFAFAITYLGRRQVTSRPH
jgi:hypothetical protein